MNFWHKYLRSKWLEKIHEKSVEVYHNKCILLFRGLNEYNEPAQALMNKDSCKCQSKAGQSDYFQHM